MSRKLHTALLFTSLVTVSACGINEDVHKKALADLAACKKQTAACEERNGDLSAKLEESKGAHEDTKTQLASLTTNLESTQDELEELRVQRASAEKRLAAYRQLNERLRELVDTGKLNVSYRNGQMVVGLPAAILFPSGKSRLSRGGRNALADIAAVLLEFKDRRFLIAGHTDDQKLKSKRYTNWNLSTDRAVSIVQFFIDQGFAAENLGAAGYGEFDPVADNSTKEGRSENRRIEIILVPDLSELPKLTEEPATPSKSDKAKKKGASAAPAEPKK